MYLYGFTMALTLWRNYARYAWTSNACHGHNFHHRDLKFSDVVPDTITIFKRRFKKNDETLITFQYGPLKLLGHCAPAWGHTVTAHPDLSSWTEPSVNHKYSDSWKVSEIYISKDQLPLFLWVWEVLLRISSNGLAAHGAS